MKGTILKATMLGFALGLLVAIGAHEALSGASPSPADLAQVLARRGVVVGAGTVIDGVPWQIAQMRFTRSGEWLTVSILPRRIREDK